MPRPVLLLLLAFVAVAARLLPAQEKTLHWRTLAVEARLDSVGRLHVRERQAMVFTGDWNGGERRFDVRIGQAFEFERLLRIDPVSGESSGGGGGGGW